MTIRSTLGTIRRFLLSPRHRAEMLTRMRHPNDHFQGSTHTAEDRYPLLFEQARLQLGPLSAPRILSFGCSTGEEVFSLAGVLPRAEILGVDINSWCVARATASASSPRTRFCERHSAAFTAAAGFDAIFALAVFQRSEHREPGSRVSGFSFARFEQELTLLDAKLKTGGLLLLDHCDFAFAETVLAPRYAALDFPGNLRLRSRPLFGRDGVRLAEEHTSPRAYRKTAA